MPIASSAFVVNSLLAQLCSDHGFSMAARTPEEFVGLLGDIDAFVDKVFILEGMGSAAHGALRARVRALVEEQLTSMGTWR